jgi:hypothetical protein
MDAHGKRKNKKLGCRPIGADEYNEIIIEIPMLYTIEGIENLNKNIDNKYGGFTSSATIDGNKIRITTSKIYKQNFVPKNDWNTLLEMIDMTNDFYSQSIILKYNN